NTSSARQKKRGIGVSPRCEAEPFMLESRSKNGTWHRISGAATKTKGGSSPPCSRRVSFVRVKTEIGRGGWQLIRIEVRPKPARASKTANLTEAKRPRRGIATQ